MRTVRWFDLEPKTRAALRARREKRWKREGEIERLHWRAVRGDRRAWKRVLHLYRTFSLPREWAEFKRDYQERVRFHRRYHHLTRQLGSILTLNQAPVQPTGESVIAGAYYVDKIAGNDANDGILVADGGDGPMQTIDEMLSRMESGTYTLSGDDIVFYIRGTGDATYALESFRDLIGGGSTAVSNKIRIIGYPGDTTPIIDGATPAAYSNFLSPGGDGPIEHSEGNFSWENLALYSDIQVFTVGRTSAAPACQFRRITQTTDGSTAGFDNAGVIYLNGGATGALLEDLDFDGSFGSNPNVACIFIETLAALTVRRSVFKHQIASSNRGILYFKHAVASDPGTGAITFDDVVLDGLESGNSVHGIWGAMNRAEWTNCLITLTGNGQVFGHSGQDNGGYAVNHANVFSHVTFYNSSGIHTVRVNDDHTGTDSGIGNSYTNCVFAPGAYLDIDQNSTSYAHATVSNYNLWPSTGNLGRFQSSTESDLATWISTLGTGQDGNSTEEDITFGASFSAGDYSTYIPNVASTAFQGGSDGDHIGVADASALGPQ